MNNDIEKLQNILKEDSSNFQARRELSILLANNGYNEEALSNLKYLEKYFSSDADIHYNIGILYEKNKDFIKAKEAYEKAMAYLEAGEYDAAIEIFEELGDYKDSRIQCEKAENAK